MQLLSLHPLVFTPYQSFLSVFVATSCSVILYVSLEVHVYFTLSQSCNHHLSPVIRSEL